MKKGKGAAQFDQRGANSNNDDGGASNHSGIQRQQQREIQRIGSGSFSASAAAAAGFSASGARGRLSCFSVDW